jgi:hypothetical protein
MAYISGQEVFSQAQTLVLAFGSTYACTNQLDTSATVPTSGAVVAGAGQARNLGVGEAYFGHLLFPTGVTQAGGTLIIRLVSSAVAALTTPTIHWDSGTFTAGVHTDGTSIANAASLIDFTIPADDKTWLRWVGFTYVVGTANITAGSVTAWIDHSKAGKPFIYANGLSY